MASFKRKRTGPYSANKKKVIRYRKSIKGYRLTMANSELKFFDTVVAENTIDSAGEILSASLNLIPQGVTESTRVGRKCVIKSIHIKGHFVHNATSVTNDTSDRIRWILYVDKQANGATSAVASILDNGDINSFRNLSETGRFRVLADKTVVINQLGGVGDGTTNAWGKVYKNLSFNVVCNIPIEFSSTTGAITEIRSNNLGLMAISEQFKGSMGYQCRVRYMDG